MGSGVGGWLSPRPGSAALTHSTLNLPVPSEGVEHHMSFLAQDHFLSNFWSMGCVVGGWLSPRQGSAALAHSTQLKSTLSSLEENHPLP